MLGCLVSVQLILFSLNFRIQAKYRRYTFVSRIYSLGILYLFQMLYCKVGFEFVLAVVDWVTLFIKKQKFLKHCHKLK
jgi:membrane glycosyltransferase